MKKCNSQDNTCIPYRTDRTIPRCDSNYSHPSEKNKNCDYNRYCAHPGSLVKGLCYGNMCKVYQYRNDACIYYPCESDFQNCEDKPEKCTEREKNNVFHTTDNEISLISSCSTNNCMFTECDYTNKKCYQTICQKEGNNCGDTVPCEGGFDKVCDPQHHESRHDNDNAHDKKDGGNDSSTPIYFMIGGAVVLFIIVFFLVYYFSSRS